MERHHHGAATGRADDDGTAHRTADGQHGGDGNGLSVADMQSAADENQWVVSQAAWTTAALFLVAEPTGDDEFELGAEAVRLAVGGRPTIRPS